MQQTSLCVHSICNTEYNRITFIALNRFQIFDKEGFIAIAFEEIFHLRCALPTLGQQFINQILLCNTERNYSKGAVRIFLNVLINQVNNKFGLSAIGMRFSVKNAVHMVIVYTNTGGIRLGRRECNKVIVIKIFIGESN